MLERGNTLPGGEIRIEAVIGEGAFGVVYRAWDETLSRSVAVKELRRDAPGMGSTTFGKYVDRFRREARVQAQFTHPHIVQVYRLLEQGEALYLVMEFVEGANLRDVLEKRGPLPVEEAVQLTLDLLDALTAVHTHKWDIVHRDIKPSNVLVADGCAKLTDFGLAQVASESSRSGHGINHPGTPLYMSPEQERTVAYLKPASDLYSVGCVLLELLTGKAYKQVDDDPDALLRLRPDAPPALAPILQRATAEDLKERYRRAADFAAELRAWLREREGRRQAEERQRQLEAEAAARQKLEAEARARQQRAAAEAAQRKREAEAAARAEEAWRQAQQITPPQPAVDVPMQQDASQRKAFPGWAWPLLGVVILIGGLWGLSNLGSGPTATPTVVQKTVAATQEVVRLSTETPSPEPEPIWAITPTVEVATTWSITPTWTADSHILGDTWTRPADGMVMVYVPAGEFQMGSAEGDSDEEPVHAVALDAFWLDRTEVSNAQYQKCVSTGDCDPSELASDSDYNGATQPVVGVSWHDAVAYCEWAGGRLPTEAEWEYAARGPEGLTYPWGNTFDGTRLNFCDKNCTYDWADKSVDDGYKFTAPVGSYPDGASWVGALDLAGNVWEWVADWHGSYPSGRQVNPTGPQSGEYRVLRGGSWIGVVNGTRGAYRYGGTPALTYLGGGFRCGVSVAPGE